MEKKFLVYKAYKREHDHLAIHEDFEYCEWSSMEEAFSEIREKMDEYSEVIIIPSIISRFVVE